MARKAKPESQARETPTEALARTLRDLRGGRRQSDLARLAGAPQSLLSEMERGSRWTVENLEQVAALFGMTGWELLRLATGDGGEGRGVEITNVEAEILHRFRGPDGPLQAARFLLELVEPPKRGR